MEIQYSWIRRACGTCKYQQWLFKTALCYSDFSIANLRHSKHPESIFSLLLCLEKKVMQWSLETLYSCIYSWKQLSIYVWGEKKVWDVLGSMQCSVKEKSQTLNGVLSIFCNLPSELIEVGTEGSLVIMLLLMLNFCFKSSLVSTSQGFTNKWSATVQERWLELCRGWQYAVLTVWFKADAHGSIIFLLGPAVIAVVFGFVCELLELVWCWCSWCRESYQLLVERMVWGVPLLGMLMIIFGAFDPSVKGLREMLLVWKMFYK